MRYWDIFFFFVSYYNIIMKLIFVLTTIFTIYLIRYKKPYCLVILINLRLMTFKMIILITTNIYIHVKYLIIISI